MDFSKLIHDVLQYVIVNYGDAIAVFVFTAITGLFAHIAATTGNRYIKYLSEQVKEVVVVAQETTVAELKKAKTDGVITKEEGEAIKAQVIARVKEKLGILGKAAVKAFAGDIEKWISEKVEFYLAELKGRL
jgi:hypothetical protein